MHAKIILRNPYFKLHFILLFILFIESKEAEQVSTPAPVCMIENGETLNDGETYCPQPNVLGTCKEGKVDYQNHCSPLTCANQMRGQNPCDCPVCVGKSVTLLSYIPYQQNCIIFR